MGEWVWVNGERANCLQIGCTAAPACRCKCKCDMMPERLGARVPLFAQIRGRPVEYTADRTCTLPT